MLKRLIEVALPLKEVSEQSAREKSIRHGHISTLHIWWARRPLAACRAAVFASLIPDPDDPECPDDFCKLVLDVLGKNQFEPTNSDGSPVEDTPRNRCLEFIKHLVKWESSNNPDYIEPAQKLITAAHKFLHPNAEGAVPRVLDPFAGGGAIPLEVLRLGGEAHAIDLNPVAYLIELCTLVYPQKYGQPDGRPVPDYIKRLIAYNRVQRKTEGGKGLFDKVEATLSTASGLIPDVEITEAEYQKNPLAADVKYWGYWVLEKARLELAQFYATESNGYVSAAYIWARTVKCPNPQCNTTLPLVSQLWRESLIAGLLRAGLIVSASWPLHTEMQTRMNARDTASLASSVTIVCRKRTKGVGDGLWDDIRQELKQVAQERLDFFWNQGIRGADFFISAIGPALLVFGKYERVTKLSGEEVTVGQFLDEVRSLVTNYALTRILHTAHTAAIDPESRFYVVWKWSYGDAKVPADESFKLSQALGMHTEEMWDRTGVLEKAGENVQTVPIAKRMRVKDLGEPSIDGAPAGLIDVLHRLCAFRERGDTQGMVQFLGQSGQANNPTLWLVAQAISEILPDGDKEKQLMQGLLNQREALEVATSQRTLF